MAFTVYIIQSDRTARYYVGHAEERDDRVRQLITKPDKSVARSTENPVACKIIVT